MAQIRTDRFSIKYYGSLQNLRSCIEQIDGIHCAHTPKGNYEMSGEELKFDITYDSDTVEPPDIMKEIEEFESTEEIRIFVP